VAGCSDAQRGGGHAVLGHSLRRAGERKQSKRHREAAPHDGRRRRIDEASRPRPFPRPPSVPLEAARPNPMELAVRTSPAQPRVVARQRDRCWKFLGLTNRSRVAPTTLPRASRHMITPPALRSGRRRSKCRWRRRAVKSTPPAADSLASDRDDGSLRYPMKAFRLLGRGVAMGPALLAATLHAAMASAQEESHCRVPNPRTLLT